MKKNLIFIVAVLLSTVSSFAFTRSFFSMAGQAQVTLGAQSMTGVQDADGYNLFQLMNVPIQDSFIGPGKAIFSANRDVNISCGQRAQSGTECSFIFNKSSRVKINPASKQIDMLINDSEASDLIKKFVLNESSEMIYQTEDHMVTLSIRNNEIRLHFTENP